MNDKLTLDDDRLYTTAQTAQLLNITERQVIRLRHAKRLGRVPISGASVRHSGAQIRAFIEAATQDAER